MKLTNKQMVEEAMERIELLQLHVNAVEAAARCLQHRRSYRGETITYGNLRDTLFEEEMKEWRNLCMWGLTLDDDERDRVKAAAHQRFLADGTHVANWFNRGVTPGSWLSADEAEFRAMAKKSFGPTP